MDENNKTPNLGEQLKGAVNEWFQSSTAHALPNIFRTRSVVIKILWLCCFLASAAYCIKSVVVSLQEYLTYPSYISTEIIQEIPTHYPAVTICNMKTVKNMQSYALNPNFLRYIVNPQLASSPFEYIIAQQYAIRTAVTNDSTLTFTTRKSIGFELKDMLISCFFNYKSCSKDDFTYSYDPLYGNCYTFNKGTDENGTRTEIKTISLTGPLYGLILELFLGSTLQTQFEYADGVFISVHNQSSSPFTESSKIVAASGADTDIIVNRNFITKLEAPYGDCLKDVSRNSKFSSTYFDYIVRTLDSSYSQKYCFSLCMQKRIIDRCSCSNTFMPVFRGVVKFCFNTNETRCMMDVVYTFGTTDASDACVAQCPFECESIQYEISTFRSFYPTEFYKTVLANASVIKNSGISFGGISTAVAKLNVYYESMTYKKIEQKVKSSTEDMFSSIGGTLGLYIGISILSVVELLELTLVLASTVIAFKSKKQQVHYEK